jgi:arylsulfatase
LILELPARSKKISKKNHAAGTNLPFPQTPSASIASRTLAESKHQWRQDPKHLPDDVPNIVIFMSDDAGFSNPDIFGGHGR